MATAAVPTHLFVANMTHISEWESTCGLLRGAAHMLGRVSNGNDGGALFVYERGAVSMHECTLDSSSCALSGNSGGAIRSYGLLELRNSAIRNCSSDQRFTLNHSQLGSVQSIYRFQEVQKEEYRVEP